jgi:hypothetical protein
VRVGWCGQGAALLFKPSSTRPPWTSASPPYTRRPSPPSSSPPLLTPPPPQTRSYEAFERAYATDHSWESLQEDEQGFLRPLVGATPLHSLDRQQCVCGSPALAVASVPLEPCVWCVFASMNSTHHTTLPSPTHRMAPRSCVRGGSVRCLLPSLRAFAGA